MATDEEISKKALELFNKHFYDEDITTEEIFEIGIRIGIEIGKKEGKKEGIQSEKERIREQVKKDSFCIVNKDRVIRNDVIHVSKIDIWDDKK